MDAASEPDAARILRKARRVRRVFRLIFYPGAAIVAFLLLTGSREPDGLLEGRTSQGDAFVMHVEGDRPVWFDTAFTSTCPSGDKTHRAWASTRRPVATRDGRFELEQSRPSRWPGGRTGTMTLRLDARVEDGAATGTLWFQNRLGSYVCSAGPVTFSAG